MQKNFTLTTKQKTFNSSQPKPKESSINFIKQFTRVCTMQKMANPELGIFIMN